MTNRIAALVGGLSSDEKRDFYRLALDLKDGGCISERTAVLEGLDDSISPKVKSAIHALYTDGNFAKVIDKLRQKA